MPPPSKSEEGFCRLPNWRTKEDYTNAPFGLCDSNFRRHGNAEMAREPWIFGKAEERIGVSYATVSQRISPWKRNQRLTSFIHLPFRSSEQIGSSSPASDSVTFQTGEPEGAFCSASEDEASRLVGLSPTFIQRDTQISQAPPPTPFPES